MAEQPSAELISLPQGGGALRAVGETFQPDLHTGTGTYRVPLELPPGRAGLTPQLALSYSSGAGTGVFGMGWSMSVPGVRRRTDKQLPRYDGTDVFVLSGAEDLAPVPGGSGAGVQRYRPRTETLFACIERHTAGTDHWVGWSKDGLRTTYGTPRPAAADGTWRDPAVIADPDDQARVLGWLITSTVDTFGNTIAYSYAPDPADPAGPQRYLTEIGYADYGDPASPSFLAQVRFSYEPRPDRHTDRRGGFPVTTRQRCTAIETWMNPGTPVLARRVALAYSDATTRPADNGVSLLTAITVTGHDGDAVQALPPLEFGYSSWDPAGRRYQPIGDPAAAPARSLAARDLDLVDLFGDGLPAVLQLSGGVGRYWRNRGAGRLDLPRGLAAVPAGASLGGPGVQVLDADGDGRPDLLVTDATRAGYFPTAPGGGFDPGGYHPYRAAPSFSLTDPNTRLIDLDGDGVVDVLRIGTRLETYLNDRAAGWVAQPGNGASPLDGVSFADPRVKLADMTGDGLTDVVLVGNGRVQYWPNLGYGRFGQPVMMSNSPRFEDARLYGPTGFDPARLLAGDVDGDGAADLVYTGPRGTTVWVNQGGTGFADPVLIPATPQPASGTAIRLADMLGTGTAGVLWSYDAGDVRGSNYTFLDLTGGVKPYLLTRIDNHAGAITTISYAPSTTFALADAAAGTPWRTTLPFPVHVVAATEASDYFSQTSLSTGYVYHHGYWDGADREFRGFGRVDHRDTLVSTAAAAADPGLSPPTETRTWFHLGPVGPEYGAWTELDLSGEYWPGDPPLAGHLDLTALPAGLPRRALRDAVRTARGTQLRQELYALDGTPLAGRPYEISDHAVAAVPVLDGRTGDDPTWLATPVVTVHPTLSRTTVWERGADPMYRIQVTGNYDTCGRPGASVDIAVPRGHDPRAGDPASAAEPYLAVLTSISYATRDDDSGYMVDRVTRTRRDHLSAATTATPALDLAAAAIAGTATTTLRGLSQTFYDGPPAAGPTIPAGQLGGLGFGQLGEHGLLVRTEQLTITPDILTAAGQPGDGTGLPAGPPPYLPLDGTPPQTLPAGYPAAFTDALAPLTGYTWHPDGTDPATGATYVAGYYTHTARHAYDIQVAAAGRGLLVAHRDPLGHDTTISNDPYGLLPAAVTDPVGLTHTAAYDYRTLHPIQVTDPNGNITQAGYTPLGLPAWTAATGKPGASQGDTPDTPGTIYSYDLTAFDDSAGLPARRPLAVTTTRRLQHRWDIISAANAARAAAGQPPLTDADIAALFPSDETDTHPENFARTTGYSDGFGRTLQIRTQADTLILDDLGLTADQSTPATPAVLRRVGPATAPAPVTVSSWKRYDNKGRVITAYEPFYDTGYDYQPPGQTRLDALAKITTRYDPRGLAVLITGPDGSQTLTVPGTPAGLTTPANYAPSPWVSYLYDPDDNAGRTHPQTSAGYAAQYNTPASITVDALARPISHTQRLTPSDVGAAVTATSYDIDGNITAVTDPLGRTAATTVYDLAKRAWRHASIDAGVTRAIHDPAGGPIEVRDDKGAITLTSYDPAHRPTRLWAADHTGQTPALRQATVYGDDTTDTSLTQADPAAANLLGRPYQTYDEAGRLTTSRYDIDGNLLTKTRQTLLADLLLSGLPTGPGSWDNTAYQIDWQPPPGQTLDQHATGLLDPTSYQTDTSCDALHRITTLTGPLDVTGARTTLTYTHTPTGQLTSITADGTAHLTHAVYNARAQRVLAVLGAGTLIRHTHDPATFRLTRLHTEPATTDPTGLTWTGAGSPQSVLQDYAYDYDLAGNLLTLHDRTPGSGLPIGSDPAHSPGPDALDRHFSYDPLYRLTSGTGRETAIPLPQPWIDTPADTDITKAQPYTETYDYDPAGRLLTLTHSSATGYTRTYGPTPGSNRLASLTVNNSTFAYSHDPTGNLTREADVRSFEWDHANRLTTFRTQTDSSGPSPYAQYRYDNAGNRVTKIVQRDLPAPDVTTYIDAHFERLTLGSGTAGTSAHDTIHIHVGTARIAALRLGNPRPGDPYPNATYHLADHIGSSAVVLDQAGVALNTEEYTPYGETSFGSYATKQYRFSAKERDEESSFSYHQARYYAPWLARWASCDPMTLTDASNPYWYCSGRPTTRVDMDGKQDTRPSTDQVNHESPPATIKQGDPPRGTFREFVHGLNQGRALGILDRVEKDMAREPTARTWGREFGHFLSLASVVMAVAGAFKGGGSSTSSRPPADLPPEPPRPGSTLTGASRPQATPTAPTEPLPGKGPLNNDTYYHSINRGGLQDIVANQRLISTPARIVAGGGEGVRASLGPLSPSAGIAPGQPPVIEFTTPVAPSRIGQPPYPGMTITWPMPEGEFLPVDIHTIHYAPW